MDLHEIFREGWQWANEQIVKFWWQSGSRVSIIGRGMCCPRASSFLMRQCFYARVCSVCEGS